MMGLFMEEIELHQRIALGTYTFTRENMIAYSRQVRSCWISCR